MGLVDDVAWEDFQNRRTALDAAAAAFRSTRIGVPEIRGQRFAGGATVADALRRPDLQFADVAFAVPGVPPDIGARAAIEVKFEGYVRRELLAVEKAAKSAGVGIPEDFAYEGILALSREAREKLSKQRPRTLGAAARIPGVTPSDVAVLSLYVQRQPA
jgi:tRNA uridine 5-carboxymethylaminomethyl modification enzyme